MPKGGSKPGERRGGRKPGTPNKLPKGTRALVKLEVAEAQVRELKARGGLETLGKDRLTELDAWAHAMAKQFAPRKDEKGKLYWESPGDEARFLRFFKLCGEFAAARAPYESPRLSAVAAGQLGGEDRTRRENCIGKVRATRRAFSGSSSFAANSPQRAPRMRARVSRRLLPDSLGVRTHTRISCASLITGSRPMRPIENSKK